MMSELDCRWLVSMGCGLKTERVSARWGAWNAHRMTLRPAAIIVAALLSGCASLSPGGHVVRGLDRHVATPIGDATSTDAARAGSDYERNPKDPKAAIAYGRALRELGAPREAVLVLARTAANNPHHGELLGEYAKALTAAGEPERALPVFETARHLRAADWSLLSAEGIALDGLGKHQDARARYQSALKLSPDNPDILANLGLSLALSGQLDVAEATLRRAVGRPGATAQVRQNLALVLGLRGRFTEAESLARGDLDPQSADNNVAVMRQLYGKPAAWADARDHAAEAALDAPETSPAPSPVVERQDATAKGATGKIGAGQGVSAATRKRQEPPSASGETTDRPSAPPQDGNGLDETFFGFPW
jgi:Flp pilus assembly protein TadD